jgi:hypothetical protein
VAVTAIETATGANETITGANGRTSFRRSATTYTIKAELTGFRTVEQRVSLQATRTLR